MSEHLSESEMQELIKERLRAVADIQQLDESTLTACLPHLAAGATPYSLDSHRKSTENQPLNAFIDHTNLKPEATAEDIVKLCKEAQQYKFAAVCVNGSRAELCRKMLQGTDVRVAAVVGFPLGAECREAKQRHAQQLFSEGVDEIDMVLNIGKLKDKDYHYVHKDIHHVVHAGSDGKQRVVKVILETCLLTPSEIVDACILSVYAGAAFVKTSTGFNKAGAKPSDVKLMKLTVGDAAQVKASGGIRTAEDARMFIQCGASRIGTSSGVAICQGQASISAY